MESIASLGIVLGVALSAYFYVHLRKLEKKSGEIDGLKQEIQLLWAQLGVDPSVAPRPAAITKAPEERHVQPVPLYGVPVAAPTRQPFV
jgi:hypothetical protein